MLFHPRNLKWWVAIAGALVLGLMACPLEQRAPCPDLSTACDAVVCDAGRVNADGCPACACAENAPTLCWDDTTCAAGTRCDTVTFCERAPGCTADGPCPNACYGRCIDAATACGITSDCRAGQICSLVSSARQRTDGEAAPPSPSGVCVDANCPDVLDLPSCPRGTEPSIDPRIDPCRPTCVPSDPCRQLLPEQCSITPGCTLFEEPCACASPPCSGCDATQRCVSKDDCSRRSPELCPEHPNCILKPVLGQEEEAALCSPENPTCTAPPPPPEALVCVPRSIDGSCIDDSGCRVGEVCVTTTACATSCAPNGTGGDSCAQQCWTDGGQCVASESACSALDAEACSADPRCALRTEAACTCADGTTICGCPETTPACGPASHPCATHADCPVGQSCFLSEQCTTCDPSDGGDIGCATPCFVEGRCVDGPPPPLPCAEDTDCGPEGSCIDVTVCDTCDADSDSRTDTVSCDATCSPKRVCAPALSCASPDSCAGDTACDPRQGPCTPPPPPTPELCHDDAECSPGFRCATELDVCLQKPDAPESGCWSPCMDTTGTYCLDDSSCEDGQKCLFAADVCLDDPASPLAVCSGWCAAACFAGPTPAFDPRSGRCVVFSSTCIPPGWVPTPAC